MTAIESISDNIDDLLQINTVTQTVEVKHAKIRIELIIRFKTDKHLGSHQNNHAIIPHVQLSFS